MFLTRISIFQPVFATMVMVAIMVFGLVSWRALPVDQYPDVDFPVVAVLTPYSGASPEVVESDVTEIIEDELSTLSGIEGITSTSSEGHSTVVVEFTLETDSMLAAQDVRDRLSAIANDLPDTADPPQVMRLNPTDEPVVSLAVSSPSMNAGRLTTLADDVIVPALTAIDGVGSASLVGAVEEEVSVRLDPDRIRSYGLGVADVIEAIEQDNRLFSAGSITDGTDALSVQVNAEFPDIESLGHLIIARQSGAPVLLHDVATLVAGTSDPDSLAFQNGRAALAIDVVKVDGANTVKVAHEVETAIERLSRDDVLGDAGIEILLNSADAIEANYETVKSTLIEGAILAVVIVFLFLNSWRSTVITGLTLPIAFLGTLAVINLLGFSLNMMTMLALTLSVGILIDDAIVVRENITRHLHMGKDHVQAALDGTEEIGFAVLATTLALCAVFLPLAFMTGIVGKFFLEFGVTVAIAVMISLFVSFTLDPMLSSVWHDPASEPGAKRGPLGRVIARFEHDFDYLGRLYQGLLVWCLDWRKTTLAAALAIFVASLAAFPLLGVEFMPVGDESRITISVKTPAGSSRDYTALKAAQITRLIEDMPEVTGIYTSVAAGSNSGDNEATIEVSLVSPDQRALSATGMVPELRKSLRQIPGAEITVAAAGGLGGGDAPVQLKVMGRNNGTLAEAAREIADLVASVPGTADVTLSVDDAQPMLDFVLLRDVASDLGVSPQAAGNVLRTLVDGNEVSSMKRPDGSTWPVVLRMPEELRTDPAYLATIPVADNNGVAITLGEITQLNRSFGPTRIERENRTRVISIEAGLDGRVVGDVMDEIDAGLAKLDLPDNVSLALDGDSELMGETVTSMAMSLMMAVVFIYLVLASQFASFIQPFAILTALPLSLVGVVLGLMVSGSTMNLYSMIGLVMLMGLVVKNAILLVDNANQHERVGLPLRDALIEAGTTRFRPIVMTTLAMIFGMLPLALAIHPGSEQSASMAQAVIGGLISSTLLTLVVVPVVLTYLAGFSRLMGRLSRGRGHSSAEARWAP